MLILQGMPQDTSPFQIYNASAGSGKTYTLTRTYLFLLFSAPQSLRFRNILAITFTNKAVGELKSRILNALMAFGRDTPEEKFLLLFEDLKFALGISAEELRQRSQRMLRLILHNYAYFDVSTIDTFNHRILRTFSRELGLSSGFEVVLDTDDLLSRAVAQLVDKAGNDPVITELLLNFALEKSAEDRHWDLSLDLQDMGASVFSEVDMPFLRILRDKKIEDYLQLNTAIEEHLKASEKEVVTLVRGMLERITASGLEAADFTRGFFPAFLQKIADGDFAPDFEAKWKQNFGSEPLYPKSREPEKKAIMDGLLEEFTPSFQRVKELLYAHAFFENAKRNFGPFTLIGLLGAELNQLEKEEGLLPIAYFNRIIADELSDQPAPYLYEKLGEQFRYYLIDEFQDTSRMQWKNLIPLVDHALTSAERPEDQGRLILVGDAKQAIYRWRGGDAEQFIDLASGADRPFSLPVTEQTLEHNYRSRKTLVEFNNDLFEFASRIFDREDYAQLYAATSRQKGQSDLIGLVRLELLSSDGDKEDNIHESRVIEILRELQDAGYGWEAICILTRSRKEGEKLSLALTEADIPIISSETLLLKNHPAIQFLIDLLEHLRNPEDENFRLGLLRYLCPEVANTHGWISENLPTLPSFLEREYHFRTSAFTGESVYDILETATARFDLAGEAAPYITALLDFCLETGNRGDKGIHSFLEAWTLRNNDLSLKSPEGQRAVRLMTIHKSKGLEFPVVILPFANHRLSRRPGDKIWVPLPKSEFADFPFLRVNNKADLEHYPPATATFVEEREHMKLDFLNVLYVAHTRARDALFVLSEPPSGGKSDPMQNYPGLYAEFLKAQGLWSAENSVYTFGKLPPGAPGEIASGEPMPFTSTEYEGLKLRVVTRPGTEWARDQGQAKEFGNLLHYGMSLILTSQDVPAALDQLLREGEIIAEDTAEVRRMMEAIVNHSELAAYFQTGLTVLNERELFSGKAVILRPDRLVLMGTKAAILDYKTGQPKLEHRMQLQSYADAIKAMGLEMEAAILVYTQGEQINLDYL